MSADSYKRYLRLGRRNKNDPLSPLLYCPEKYIHKFNNHKVSRPSEESRAVFWLTRRGYKPGYAIVEVEGKILDSDLSNKTRKLIQDFEAGGLAPPESITRIIYGLTSEEELEEVGNEKEDNPKKEIKTARLGDRWVCRIAGCEYEGSFADRSSAYRHIAEKHECKKRKRTESEIKKSRESKPKGRPTKKRDPKSLYMDSVSRLLGYDEATLKAPTAEEDSDVLIRAKQAYIAMTFFADAKFSNP